MSGSSSKGIRILQYSQSCVRILGDCVEAVQSALFMGFIDDKAFQVFDTYPFDESREISVDKESELGLEPWELQIAQQHLQEKRSLLVIAAGGNRELLGFKEMGYSTDGIEYGWKLCKASKQALTVAQQEISMELADRLSVPDAIEPYDAVFIARKYLSHVHGRTKRIEFLKNIREALKHDAVLACGFYTREHDGLVFRAQAFVANILRKIRGCKQQQVETGDHLDPDTPLYHHHFTLEEIRAEFQEAGFELVDHADDWFSWAVARAA